MARARHKDNETDRLAARFLGVFEELIQLTNNETPGDVVAQLSVNQLRTLDLIYRQPGISQKELAEQLNVTPASVSIWISRMLESELVERHPHEDDARVMCLYLGAVGRGLVQKVKKMQTDSVADLLSGLPLEEQQAVVEALERALLIHKNKLEAVGSGEV